MPFIRKMMGSLRFKKDVKTTKREVEHKLSIEIIIPPDIIEEFVALGITEFDVSKINFRANKIVCEATSIANQEFYKGGY